MLWLLGHLHSQQLYFAALVPAGPMLALPSAIPAPEVSVCHQVNARGRGNGFTGRGASSQSIQDLMPSLAPSLPRAAQLGSQ